MGGNGSRAAFGSLRVSSTVVGAHWFDGRRNVAGGLVEVHRNAAADIDAGLLDPDM